MEEEHVYLNPHEDNIIGVDSEFMYFKPEGRDYVIMTKEKEYLKILKEYIKTKRDFCERYDHFCGIFGEFSAKQYVKLESTVTLNEYIDVEDDGENEGLELKQTPYTVYLVRRFDKRCDMEHG